ncbi:MAG: Transposase [Conexibacter sp.]|nr:Transposase [Conexibacter sp.]
MLHAGLDLSRRKVDVCLLSGAGEIVDEWASPPDADGLRGVAARTAMWGSPVRGVIESMNGARFVHDRLEEQGWDVLIADATKVKGLAPLACKTDKIDARVLATLVGVVRAGRSGTGDGAGWTRLGGRQRTPVRRSRTW